MYGSEEKFMQGVGRETWRDQLQDFGMDGRTKLKWTLQKKD